MVQDAAGSLGNSLTFLKVSCASPGRCASRSEEGGGEEAYMLDPCSEQITNALNGCHAQHFGETGRKRKREIEGEKRSHMSESLTKLVLCTLWWMDDGWCHPV